MRTLLLIGTGLVGGSFALACKAHGVFDRVVGADADAERRRQALALGVIDAEAQAAPAGRFEAVCVAVPVGGIAAWVRRAEHLAPVVFDVGSVKRSVLRALGTPPRHFVPCHPIAGSERAGPDAARADLFHGRNVVLTPVAKTSAAATATVRDYWRAVGARTVELDADDHDRRFAVLSHAPHAIAFAYMEVVAAQGGGEAPARSMDGAGTGFRDFTRIAAASAEVWSDILCANAEHVADVLDAAIERLSTMRANIASGGPQLRQRIAAAADTRRGLDRVER